LAFVIIYIRLLHPIRPGEKKIAAEIKRYPERPVCYKN
jgi:hypothetical protein